MTKHNSPSAPVGAGSDEHVEVLLALALDSKNISGPCPPLEDIAAWHDGKLAETQAQAVREHVARCQRCYAIWRGLAEAQQELRPTPPLSVSPTSGWHKLLDTLRRPKWTPASTGLATAAASVLVIAVLVPFLRQSSLEDTVNSGYQQLAALDIPESWAWYDPLAPQAPVARSSADPDRQSLRSGIRQGIEKAPIGASDYWRNVIRQLPAEEIPCRPTDDDCNTRTTILRQAGRWTTLIHLACATPKTNATFWPTQVRVAKKLATALKTLEPTPTVAIDYAIAAHNAETGDAQRSLCAAAFNMLTRTLSDSP